MPIARPDDTPPASRDDRRQPGATLQPEPAPAPAPAREATPEPAGDAEVVPLRGSGTADVTQGDTDREAEAVSAAPTPAGTRPRAALEVWTRDVADTATAAVDGSVWRARPASLRDREARIRRAEWSGGIPALAVPGRVYGYLIALPATVVLRAAEQAVSRPARLLVLVLAVLIPLLVA